MKARLVLSEHHATVVWRLSGNEFAKGRYSREHVWRFDGGVELPASPSPLVVPAPWSNPNHVDPEEAYVASVTSCHMLTFLYLASKAGWVVHAYEDHAVGEMTKNERRVPWVSRVILNPKIVWGDRVPSVEEVSRLHHEAHEGCFIANSIKSEVVVASA